MVPGFVWAITSILLIGVSRALFVVGSEKVESDFAIQSRLRAYYAFITTTLIFGILITGVLMLWVEMAQLWPSSSTILSAYNFFNMACFIGTAVSGSSILAYTPLSYEAPSPQFSDILTQNLVYLSSLASSLLVLLISMYSRPVVISWVQFAPYLKAFACLVGFEQIHNLIFTWLDTTYSQA
jgi:hypothetical protein